MSDSKTASQGTIVAFHTTDPLYAHEAERLTASIERLGLRLSITNLAPGAWLDIVRMKAGFLLERRMNFRGPLLYVDVDAVVHSDPWAHLEGVDGDAGYAVLKDGKARSGTMYFADTSGAVRFIQDWMGRLERAPAAWDQYPLDDIFHAQQAGSLTGYRIATLSPALCYIFDKAEKTGAVGYKPVIEHLQASRDVKSMGRQDQLRRAQRVREIEVELGMRDSGQDFLAYAEIGQEDRHKRTQAMRDAQQSDKPRWGNPDNLQAGWNSRAAAAAKLISPPSSVIDLGCGAMGIEKELASGISYQPADLVARDERTLVFDANKNELPDYDADVVTALGFLEYIHDPAAFFRKLARWPRAIITYNPVDLDNGRDRHVHGWFNDLTSAQVVALAEAAGFRLNAVVPFEKRQVIYDFEQA